MRSLDVFSGIGGMTHALRDLGIQPVGYVEIAEAAQAVLKARMASGDLPVAPVVSDVKALDDAHLRELADAAGGPIDLLVGGTPCQGFSTIGGQSGLDHVQSGLFREFLRLATLAKPKLLFIENVAAIRAHTEDFREIIASLSAAGYSLRWITMPAFAVGAPHFRRRWYCLGVRDGVIDSGVTFAQRQPWTAFRWDQGEPVERMVLNKVSAIRDKLLGNSVVPDAVRAAFLSLVTGFRIPHTDLVCASQITLAECDSRPTQVVKNMPQCGTFDGTVIGRARSPIDFPVLPPLTPPFCITLNPAKFPRRVERHKTNTLDALESPSSLRSWATPRYGNPRVCQTLTRRSQRDLGTQLRFEEHTPDHLRNGLPNPEWIEWLMGFPTGWTAC